VATKFIDVTQNSNFRATQGAGGTLTNQVRITYDDTLKSAQIVAAIEIAKQRIIQIETDR
jgi:hypothetical protein